MILVIARQSYRRYVLDAVLVDSIGCPRHLISAAAIYILSQAVGRNDVDLRAGWAFSALLYELVGYDIAVPSDNAAATVTVFGSPAARAIAETDGTVSRDQPGVVEHSFRRDSKRPGNRA